jgi:hypothetical protein
MGRALYAGCCVFYFQKSPRIERISFEMIVHGMGMWNEKFRVIAVIVRQCIL